MNELEKQEILDKIASQGSINEVEDHNIINGNMIHILNKASGSPRLQTNVVSRFKLLLSQPEILKDYSSLAIRCALCKRVISYPCWYYRKDYNVNKFHWFVCFSPADSSKATTHCFRK